MTTLADPMVAAHSCEGCGLVLLSLARSAVDTPIWTMQVEAAKRALPLCADCRARERREGKAV